MATIDKTVIFCIFFLFSVNTFMFFFGYDLGDSYHNSGSPEKAVENLPAVANNGTDYGFWYWAYNVGLAWTGLPFFESEVHAYVSDDPKSQGSINQLYNLFTFGQFSSIRDNVPLRLILVLIIQTLPLVIIMAKVLDWGRGI